MKKFILALALVTLASPLAQASDGPLRAGITSLEITPQVGVPLAGYGGGARRLIPWDVKDEYPYATFMHPSEGVLDPIRVKTLYLERDGKKLIFISLDVVGVTADVRKDLLARVAHLGVGEDELFISATHTHSGPGTLSRNNFWQLLTMDRFQSSVYNVVLSDIAHSVQAAYLKAQPAELYSGSFAAEGLQKNRRVEKRGFDNIANLLLVKSLGNGEWLGGLVNFAIHGTSMGMGNFLYSADAPGAIEREMENKVAALNPNSRKRVSFLFLNGAEGDVSPYKAGHGRMKGIARDFAAQSDIALQNLQLVEPVWDVKKTEIKLKSPQLNIAGCINSPDQESKVFKRFAVPVGKLMPRHAAVWQIKLGPLMMMTWPGEPNTSLGKMLKAAAAETGNTQTWVLGLTNDHLSYFTSKDEYAAGGYEACASFYGADGGPAIIRAHRKLLGLKP